MPTPFERFSRSLTRDNLWVYILTLLKEQDMYPYEIREKVRQKFGFLPGNVTAYMVLKKLEAGGYVRAVRRVKDHGPEKTYYEITEKGGKEIKNASRLYKEIGKKLF
ncbi:MAG: PadR family transcriptional regulator [Candidatus Aenigmarchaeota archaeon]|nr:PadR family transcriptional regulator [Candidatus Aenigmarchaeota archaeon]